MVDSGDQGIYRYHKKSVYPYKNTKCQKITSVAKDHNTLLAKNRIKVEHIIRNIKTFNILSHKYRNKRKRYNIKFNTIAGIVNLNHGF
ncbi:MAG: 50S ribosomal protein L7/L12 [Candidatus Xenolissoclinum pacificiensis L6]|uniref:50S ribosomal protein L7/L12 n=1 Tax=Candidatus Xenolissoclinum pacificiensis L6 TaxID=1401685 RepID=W2V0A7_9RICK|nr:MAG: 50S ribosomal protein L7/L12 [Candidatus Xenolissoclinum pacificiensis L6]